MAYIAGIVDGEGSITYGQRLEHRKGKPRAYKYWNIRIEVAMTHKETIEYLHQALGCGHVNIRPKMSHQNFDQWRWRCSHRDALEVAKAIGLRPEQICHIERKSPTAFKADFYRYCVP